MDEGNKKPHLLFPAHLSIAKVIAPYKYKRNITRVIEQIGEVQPIMVDPRIGADHIKVESRRNEFEGYRTKLNNYLSSLNKNKIRKHDKLTVGPSEEDVTNFVKNIINNQGKEIEELINRKELLKTRKSELEHLIKLLERFNTLDVDAFILADTQHTKTFFASVFPSQIERLLWYVDQVTDGRYFFLDKTISEEEAVILISVLQKDTSVVQEKLNVVNAQEIIIPHDVDTDGLSISDCVHEISQIDEETKRIEKEIIQFAVEKGYIIKGAAEIVDIELARIDVELKMKRTETTCVLWAWIPENLIPEFQTKITEATNGSSTFDFKKGDFDPENSPSYFKNSKFMQPMRSIVTSYGVPSHEEVDPYPFVKWLFPILFGIMFADVGHGLILLTIALIIKRKKDKMDEIPKGISSYMYGGAELLILMGLYSTILGFVFNSVLGDETILWVYLPFLRNLFENNVWSFFFTVHNGEIERNYLNFLIFSFGMGAVVILLGLVLNIYKTSIYRHHDSELQVAIALFAGYFLIVLAAILLVTPLPKFIAMALAILGVLSLISVMIIDGRAHGVEGVMLGLDHVVSLLSNTLSFGRLLAMNTIHFVLATLPLIFINLALPGVMNHHVETWVPPELRVWWLIGALLGAAIVVPVETVFSSLQSLRLNWVEFFSKFFKGSGILFKPVMVKRIFTTELN